MKRIDKFINNHPIIIGILIILAFGVAGAIDCDTATQEAAIYNTEK